MDSKLKGLIGNEHKLLSKHARKTRRSLSVSQASGLAGSFGSLRGLCRLMFRGSGNIDGSSPFHTTETHFPGVLLTVVAH